MGDVALARRQPERPDRDRRPPGARGGPRAARARRPRGGSAWKQVVAVLERERRRVAVDDLADAVHARAHEDDRGDRERRAGRRSTRIVVRSRTPSRRRTSAGSVGSNSGRTSVMTPWPPAPARAPRRLRRSTGRRAQPGGDRQQRPRQRILQVRRVHEGVQDERAVGRREPGARHHRRARPACAARVRSPSNSSASESATSARYAARPITPCSAVTVSGIVCEAAATFSELTLLALAVALGVRARPEAVAPAGRGPSAGRRRSGSRARSSPGRAPSRCRSRG